MTYNETRRRFTAEVNTSALKMAMQFNRMSNAEVAKYSGVSKGTISNLTSGARKNVNPETAAKIEKGLRVDAGSIFSLKVLNADSTANTRKIPA